MCSASPHPIHIPIQTTMYMCFEFDSTVFFLQNQKKNEYKIDKYCPKVFLFFHYICLSLPELSVPDGSSDWIAVAAGAWISGWMYRRKVCSSGVSQRLDDEGERRRTRRVGVYDRPAAHKSIPDWLKAKTPLPAFITEIPASGRQVR